MFEDYLIKLLEKSVEKNGEVVLTNKYLLNILKMAELQSERLCYEAEINADMLEATVDSGCY